MNWDRNGGLAVFPWPSRHGRHPRLCLESLAASSRGTRGSGLVALTKAFCRPRFWPDGEVRRALIDLYGAMSIDRARDALMATFGNARCPSRSAIARFWSSLDAFLGGLQLSDARRAREPVTVVLTGGAAKH